MIVSADNIKRCLSLTSLVFFLTVNSLASGPVTPVFTELKLGEIKPEGWLKEALVRQRNGVSAHLDETYSEVCGPDNGWLGGKGDQWERGPYWIDGLLPLAYILDDSLLKEKVGKWVEWTLQSQSDDGQFGPRTDYEPRKGIQRTKALDWWPRMVMLKVMQQYYNATEDKRVLTFLDRYFRYQLTTLSNKRLDHWSKWAPFRSSDNMLVAMWLYHQTHEDYLLELCRLLHSQSFDFVSFFRGVELSRPGAIHCVNLAQGLKEPTVYYLSTGDSSLLDATMEGLEKIRRWNGFPNGMFGGDETLHGNSPTQGSELCSAVELMYSYEEMLKATGNALFAEELERVAFNALAAQISDDFTLHQYFQQSNQIHVCEGAHNFDVYNQGTSLVFGFLTGYPCCLCNMHQGWPKFIQNLWYRQGNGFAAMTYAPCRFSSSLDGVNGGKITIEELTNYPFSDTVNFRITLSGVKSASLPLRFRIPSWSASSQVSVNGESLSCKTTNGILSIERKWQSGDTIELRFPMRIRFSRWASNSVAVERGPLVYALKIEEKWEKKNLDSKRGKGDFMWEISPTTPWNYALLGKSMRDTDGWFKEYVIEKVPLWPWNPTHSPIEINVRMTKVPSWKEYNGNAGPLPYSPSASGLEYDLNNRSSRHLSDGKMYEVKLIPYGCTNLRITQFPVIEM